MSIEKLVIMGFGGHARSVADIALSQNISSLLFIDENARENETFINFPVLKQYPASVSACIPAAGDNARREQQFRHALECNWPLVSIKSIHSRQGVGTNIGRGSVMGHFSLVGPMAKIGLACIINNGAIIEHDCVVGDFCHVSVNAVLAGKVSLGDHVFVGAGAVIKDGIKIGRHIIVGAGATVVNDLEVPGVYIGTPARLHKAFFVAQS